MQLGDVVFWFCLSKETVTAEDVQKLDRARLREELLAEFDWVVVEVSDAIDDASAGTATGKRKRHKGRQRYSVPSVNGRVRLCRVRWHCPR